MAQPSATTRWRHIVLRPDANLSELARALAEAHDARVENHRFDVAEAHVVELGDARWVRYGHFEDVGVKIAEVHGERALFEEVRDAAPGRPLEDLREVYDAATGAARRALLADLLAAENHQSDTVLSHVRSLGRSDDVEDREYFVRLAGRFPWFTLRGRVAELAFQDTHTAVRSLAQTVLRNHDGPWFSDNLDGDNRLYRDSIEWPVLWLMHGWDAQTAFDELAEQHGWVELEDTPIWSKHRQAVLWDAPGGGTSVARRRWIRQSAARRGVPHDRFRNIRRLR